MLKRVSSVPPAVFSLNVSVLDERMSVGRALTSKLSANGVEAAVKPVAVSFEIAVTLKLSVSDQVTGPLSCKPVSCAGVKLQTPFPRKVPALKVMASGTFAMRISSAGTFLGNGVWSLTPAQLTGLQLNG